MSRKSKSRRRKSRHHVDNRRNAVAATANVKTAEETISPDRIMHGEQDVDTWQQALYWIVVVWAISRVVLTAVGVFAREWDVLGWDTNSPFAVGYPWLDIWGAWDTGWYYDIAENGYSAEPQHQSQTNYAFFPLYPWLARYVGVLFGHSYLGGLFVSNVAILIGAWFLYRWVEFEKNRDTAKKTVLFMFLFPTSYVFSAMMTEALFISFSIAAWYYARRGNWLLAGLLGGLSAMTRSLGVLIAVPLGLEYLRQRNFRMTYNPLLLVSNFMRVLDLRVLYLGLVPTGLAVFMWVCWYVVGNPLAFIEIQGAWRAEQWGNPVSVVYVNVVKWYNAWQQTGTFGLENGTLGFAYGALLPVFVVAILIYHRKQIQLSLWLWSLALVLVPLSVSYNTLSMPRFLVVIFPFYVMLATFRVKSWQFWASVTVLVVLLVISMALWTTGKIWSL